MSNDAETARIAPDDSNFSNAEMVVVQIGPPCKQTPLVAGRAIADMLNHLAEAPSETLVNVCVAGFDDDPRELWDIPGVPAWVARCISVAHKRTRKKTPVRLDRWTLEWMKRCAAVL